MKHLLVIYMVFFGNAEKSIQPKMVTEVSKFYGATVKIIEPIPLPPSAYYRPRNRYRADSILRFLDRIHPGKTILAFTNKDISCTLHGVEDWGVFGLGSLRNGKAVMSTNRLKKGSQQAINNKILNVALHEIGHSKGIPHCENKLCLMQDAEGKVPVSFSKAPYMCSSCRKKAKYVPFLKKIIGRSEQTKGCKTAAFDSSVLFPFSAYS